MIFGIDQHERLRPAIVSGGDGACLNFEQLSAAVDKNREIMAALPRPALAMLYCRNSVGSILAYLGCLAAKVPVCLVEPKTNVISGLVEHYHPSCIILPRDETPAVGYSHEIPLADGDCRVCVHPDRAPYSCQLHDSLALLLATSGSTGNPKLVRLSRGNLIANAKAISQYLQLGADERSVQSLPMHYAYGLSLINSHLFAGGTVVLNPHSFMRMEFWSVFDQAQCTSFAGVPFMYELLYRLNFNPAARPSLRTMTQAGGALKESLAAAYHQTALRNDKRLFVMYGQTEATARISYVPPDQLGDKIGSIGLPVSGGRLTLESVDGSPDLQQLIYEGPNVMLGYATHPRDLSRGDVQQGTLRTGDLGSVDSDGYFYVSGRLKRIAKVFGRRVNLVDIETEVERRFACRAAAVERGNKIGLFVEPIESLSAAAVRLHVAAFLSERPHAVHVALVDRIPLTSSGKKDYPALVTA